MTTKQACPQLVWLGALLLFVTLGGPLPTATAAELSRDAIREFSVPSPYRIGEEARSGTIRYRLGFDDGRIWHWPETGEQHVEWRDGAAVVTVCNACGAEPPPTAAELERYLRATAWLESEDRRIKSFARQARTGSVDLRMRHLVRAVQERLSGDIDYHHFRSAREAFDARGGDCTAFAVLLAAAARANGIPARLAAGVAYASRFVGTPHAFGPHVWVQAWDGERWASHDAGLGRFDAGHLALALSDGHPGSLDGVLDAIGALRIEDAAGIVREKPVR